MINRYSIILILILKTFLAFSQEKSIVYGTITDENGNAIDLTNLSIEGKSGGCTTDKNGFYELQIPSNTDVTVLISYIGIVRGKFLINLSEGTKRQVNRSVSISNNLNEITITSTHILDAGYTRIDPRIAVVIPSASGGIESIIKTLPGVASNNELSSQYTVRGGNYDENLVYVNDIEIYRPILLRSGQQEGLSFINSDLVSSVQFSAGGFEAKYGDKMSSVLDIKYKNPERFAGSVNLSLLGVSFHLEGKTKNDKLSTLIGFRQKSNQYLLKSLDTKGDYKPSFTDIQTLINFQASKKLKFSFLGNYARNKFQLIPQNRETDFGTVQQVLRLKIYFDGNESDMFETFFGAFSSAYTPNDKNKLKLTLSAFSSSESETYDIQGQYWLDEIQADFGNDNMGEVKYNKGVGTFLNHARNYLNSYVYNAELRGSHSYSEHLLQWGIKYQHEIIHDKIKEWQMIDSAGYTIPRPNDSIGFHNPELQRDYDFVMKELISSRNNLSSNRISAFVQNTFNFSIDTASLNIVAGVRFTYWDLNSEINISPRLALILKPHWKKDIVFRIASGLYYQPPFYKEMLDLDGKLNTNIKAQESIHITAGMDWNFKIWHRPFKITTEIYYKFLNNIIPYQIDNIRLRYYGTNNAKGYASGIDLKIAGEFVKGVDSWFSISLMQTREDIEGDYYYNYYDLNGVKTGSGPEPNPKATENKRIEPGYIPRPSDQLVLFNLFFQDYIPKYPTWKMHLNLLFGSGLPFGPPGDDRYKQTYRMPSYRRVDIGFSKQLISEATRIKKSNPLSKLKTLWVSVEVFNLLQISNTVSYLWITDVNNNMYAVPNYLTPRLLNVKLSASF